MTSLPLNSFRTGSICGSILKMENETVAASVLRCFYLGRRRKIRKQRELHKAGKFKRGFSIDKIILHGFFKNMYLDFIRVACLLSVHFSSTAVGISLIINVDFVVV